MLSFLPPLSNNVKEKEITMGIGDGVRLAIGWFIGTVIVAAVVVAGGVIGSTVADAISNKKDVLDEKPSEA